MADIGWEPPCRRRCYRRAASEALHSRKVAVLDRCIYSAGRLCDRHPDNSVLAQYPGQDIFESDFRKRITRAVCFGKDAFPYRKKPRLLVFLDPFKRDASRAR